MDVNQSKIMIEVAYAQPHKQKIVSFTVNEGCNAYDAVCQSGIKNHFPEIDYENMSIGIFSKSIKKPTEHIMREGERIEIYRPLMIDPKQARANRAAKSKAEHDAK